MAEAEYYNWKGMVHAKFNIAWKMRRYQNEITQWFNILNFFHIALTPNTSATTYISVHKPRSSNRPWNKLPSQIHLSKSIYWPAVTPSTCIPALWSALAATQPVAKGKTPARLSANYSRVQWDQPSAFPLYVAKTSSVWWISGLAFRST